MNRFPPINPSSPNPAALPPAPQPFHMSEPHQDRGLWCFWLTAEEPVLDYVAHLHCILPMSTGSFFRRPLGRALFGINPRYDYHEAWLWIKELLEQEARPVELTPSWEDAIIDACQLTDHSSDF